MRSSGSSVAASVQKSVHGSRNALDIGSARRMDSSLTAVGAFGSNPAGSGIGR